MIVGFIVAAANMSNAVPIMRDEAATHRSSVFIPVQLGREVILPKRTDGLSNKELEELRFDVSGALEVPPSRRFQWL